MPFVAVAVAEDRTPAGPLAESFSWTPGMTSPSLLPLPSRWTSCRCLPGAPFSPKGARGSGRGHPLSFCVWGYKYTLFTLPDDTRVIFFFSSSSCLPLDTCLKDKAVLE